MLISNIYNPCRCRVHTRTQVNLLMGGVDKSGAHLHYMDYLGTKMNEYWNRSSVVLCDSGVLAGAASVSCDDCTRAPLSLSVPLTYLLCYFIII